MLTRVGESPRFVRLREVARYHGDNIDRALAYLNRKNQQISAVARRVDDAARAPIVYGARGAVFASELGLIPKDIGGAALNVARSYEALRHGLTGEKALVNL